MQAKWSKGNKRFDFRFHFSAEAFCWHLRVDRRLEEEKHNCFHLLNSVTIIYPQLYVLICQHKKQAGMCKHFILRNDSKYKWIELYPVSESDATIFSNVFAQGEFPIDLFEM